MLSPNAFIDFLSDNGVDFFTGVPDSLLQGFCAAVLSKNNNSNNHIIAPNEGSAVALAAGHYLSTGNVGLVYMQNSGIGNATNPVASLTDEKVYGIPVLYLVGWRGEPGEKDEPQHIKQGEITLRLLEDLDITCKIITKETSMEDIADAYLNLAQSEFSKGRSFAFVAKKNTFAVEDDIPLENGYNFSREEAITQILGFIEENDAVVSTTGKISREIYEYRASQGEEGKDFMTVGSMGHASMIALKIALNKPERKVWCFDGDGALLMHMGGLRLIGSLSPKNYYHIVFNNCGHESVGGLPNAAKGMAISQIAKECGYINTYCVSDSSELALALNNCKADRAPVLIQVNVSMASRQNLGRPTSSPAKNKQAFMDFLKG